MLRIQQKIKLDEYEDVDQMSVDFDLMLSNAKAFYKRSTSEHKDACDLWDLFVDHKCRLFDDGSADGDGKGKIILKMGKLVSCQIETDFDCKFWPYLIIIHHAGTSCCGGRS